MPYRPAGASLPLTPLVFEVLLALADGDLHGYAILQAVAQRLGGLLPLRTGTLYRVLARLLDEGLIVELAPATIDGERRRRYRLTATGRAHLRAESERLASQVDAARAKRLLTEPRS
jgi:DNA-binding PadR family transcriptional regulator